MKLSWAAVLVQSTLVAGALVSAQAGVAQALPDVPAPQTGAAVPDSPRPQTLPDVRSVAPGKGSSGSADASPVQADTDPNAPGATLRSSPASDALQTEPQQNVAPSANPVLGAGGRVEDIQDSGVTLSVRTNFVQIPFTVKDKHGALVPALTWRDVQVYENGVRKHLSFFSSSPFPLSVAFVIDQTLPFEVMRQVNYSLGAVQGAFSAYDEVAVYTYANGVRQQTTFTGAQSARLAAVLEQSKGSGREMTYVSDGPLNQNYSQNDGANASLNPLANRDHGARATGTESNPEKEFHPLYDAVFQAAQDLAKTGKDRRRVLYVVSDGRESGSKIHEKELVRYLQEHQIAVYGTVVGDSATPYVGFLDKYHLPFSRMRDNALPRLASLTGGESLSEFRVKGIEESFARIGDDVRLSYTVGYYSNEPLTDGKYRSVEVRVLKPDLDVIAKKGYYPTPETMRGPADATRVTMKSPVPAANQ